MWIRAQRFKIWWRAALTGTWLDPVGMAQRSANSVQIFHRIGAIQNCRSLTSHGELKQAIIRLGLHSVPQNKRSVTKSGGLTLKAVAFSPVYIWLKITRRNPFPKYFDTKLTDIQQPTYVKWNSQINLPGKLWTFCVTKKTWASKGPTFLLLSSEL